MRKSAQLHWIPWLWIQLTGPVVIHLTASGDLERLGKSFALGEPGGRWSFLVDLASGCWDDAQESKRRGCDWYLNEQLWLGNHFPNLPTKVRSSWPLSHLSLLTWRISSRPNCDVELIKASMEAKSAPSPGDENMWKPFATVRFRGYVVLEGGEFLTSQSRIMIWDRWI